MLLVLIADFGISIEISKSLNLKIKNDILSCKQPAFVP